MVNLGVLEAGQGQVDRARGLYEKAIETGHPEAAPVAMVDLGGLEKAQGPVDRARGWYGKAIETGHPDQAPIAMFNLGVLENGQSRVDRARGWLRQGGRIGPSLRCVGRDGQFRGPGGR